MSRKAEEASKRRTGARLAQWACAAACALLLAPPALAARIVDVRVGRHDDFARIVFELDAPAGYKVERRAGAGGSSELVISLDATSQPRTIRSSSKLVDRVEVSEQRGRSLARVKLSGEGLKLKEMILANPPRIVLDVLAPARPKPVQAAKAAPKPSAKPTAKPKPTAEATTKPTARATKPKPAEKPIAVAKPAAKPGAAPEPKAEVAAEAAKRGGGPPPGYVNIPEEMRNVPGRAMPTPPASLPPNAGTPGTSRPQQIAMAQPKPAPPSAAPSEAKPRPTPPAMPSPRPAPKPSATARPAMPAAAPAPAEDGLFSLTNVYLAAGAFVLLAGIVLLVLRRRSAAQMVDASAFDNPLGEENPFAGFEPGEEEDQRPLSEQIKDGPDQVATQIIDGPEKRRQEVGKMGTATDSATTAMMDAPPIPGMAGGEDVQRMVREFERRVATLESRIDELVDARERLERQVAAQTEELRVQRAAIARTQRAVRNLSRPDEDSPTEPALRDPQ